MKSFGYRTWRFINLGDICIALDEEARINIDDLTGLDSNETNSDTLTILIVDSETGHGIEGAEGLFLVTLK